LAGARIIEQMLRQLTGTTPLIMDCAPGTSCNVIAVAKHADFALLVTEATPFGAHDLEASIKLLQSLGLPGAIVVNRSVEDAGLISDVADHYQLPIIARLPFSRHAAALTAAGKLLQGEDFPEMFAQLGDRIRGLIRCN
jgi:MinD superfamily P-loop ATPase